MARIEQKNNATVRMANWYTRRSYGRDTEIAGVMAHSPPNFRGYGMFEFFHERSHAVDEKLKALAATKAACLIGCQFCLDIGSHLSREAGVTEEQLVMKVVQKDGDRFPELVREVHARIVAPGHAQAAAIFERMFADLGIEDRNPRAIAAVALGALVDYRIEETMFGVPPGGIGEEEFIAAWVDTWESFARGAAAPRQRKEK